MHGQLTDAMHCTVQTRQFIAYALSTASKVKRPQAVYSASAGRKALPQPAAGEAWQNVTV